MQQQTTTHTTATTHSHPDLYSYDHIIVAFSGGKDSLASLLTVLELAPEHQGIELWHHDIDGMGEHFMDYPITLAYCRAVAHAFGLPFYVQYKVGGFKQEMMRENQPTAPTRWEQPDGTMGQTGGKGKANTRLMFPQVSANLSTRWCSSYLKIQPCEAAIRGQARFNHSKTLVVTGERAQESSNRAHYATFEPHSVDTRNGRKSRHVDHWRPVHSWPETAVWEQIKQRRVNPHPAYKAGYSRVSCMHCIFADEDQVATSQLIDPDGIQVLADLEILTGKTIHRSKSLPERAAAGQPYEALTPELAQMLMSEVYTEPIILGPDEWQLPAGAFGHSCGPT